MAKHNVEIYVPNIDQNDRWYLPIVWAYLKAYYDHSGKYPEKFNWLPPQINPENNYHVKERLLENPPSVFGFSGYIWNIYQCYRTAEWVKEQFPDCLVVAGGPQPEYKWDSTYFKKHPYIDIVVPFEGEEPLTDILNLVAEGRDDFEACANLILPDPKNPLQGWKKSDRNVPRKDFVFPPSSFLQCSKELEACMQEAVDKDRLVATSMEFNRGCPYKCTFCDWGGGTYTKIRKKTQDTVEEELQWITTQPVHFLAITDANLGVFKQDVENVKRLVELRKETGYPKLVRYSAAKNSKDRVLEIFLLLAREGANENYSHAFQDTAGEVKDIIQRKDISWEESLEIARTVKAEGFESYLQMILGLPGQSWETFFYNIDYVMGEGGLFSWPRFYQFLLLPNSPAAEPAYRDKYQIEFVERGTTDELPRIRTDVPTGGFTSTASYIQEGYEHQRGWYVIQTSTYTREDYVQLFTLSYVLFSLHTLEMTKPIADYLHERYGIKYSDFYRGVYEDFMLKEDPETSAVGGLLQHWLTHFRKWCAEETENSYAETCVPWNDTEMPWEFPGNMYFQYHMLYHKDEFFQRLKIYLGETFQIPELSDLVNYSQNTVIDFNHSLEERKIFQCDYNWEGYFAEETELEEGKFFYEVMDQTVTYGHKRGTYPIDWQNAQDLREKKIQFIYRVAYSRHNSGRYTEVIRLPSL